MHTLRPPALRCTPTRLHLSLWFGCALFRRCALPLGRARHCRARRAPRRYYDTTQVALGSCTVDDVAVRVLTRVVGHYPKSNTLVIDCGWTGASAQGKEAGYGCFPEHAELRIASLSQESGRVASADGSPLDFARYPIGSLLALAPFHSCASTHQHAVVHVLDEDRRTIVDEWKVCKGW
jgi:D-serine deaminase-like pyridoxal phosphate-dependent protein